MTNLLNEARLFISQYDLDIRSVEIENTDSPTIHMIGDLTTNIDFYHQFSEYFAPNEDSVSYSIGNLVIELS